MSKVYKFIIFLSLVFVIFSLSIYFDKDRFYVPYVRHQSSIEHFEQAQYFVTIEPHYDRLKTKMPNIQMIQKDDLNNYLDKGYVAVLPWNFTSFDVRALKVNNEYFYHSKNGTIVVSEYSMKTSQYYQFLTDRNIVSIAGTVVLARGVASIIDYYDDPEFPWVGTKSIFDQSNFNIVNFKSPLVRQYVKPSSSWVLVGQQSYATGLKYANINLVSLSGNHMGDAGTDGLIETIDALAQQQVLSVGAGLKDDAYRCRRVRVRDQVFGFLAFNSVGGSIGKASSSKIGIAWLDQDALSATHACSKIVDTLVVIVNWGKEYSHSPTNIEVEWAEKLVENGADLIAGDQAHWVQYFDIIDDVHVSYGLGNFIFDQKWSENTREGIIQQYVYFEKQLLYVETIPIKLNDLGGVDILHFGDDRYKYTMSVYNPEK